MELLLLGIFSAVLLACIFTGVSVIYAMLLGLAMFFGYGLIKKKTWKQMIQNLSVNIHSRHFFFAFSLHHTQKFPTILFIKACMVCY